MNSIQQRTRTTSSSMAFRLMMQWLEWNTAYILEDTRKAYPERRYQALGLIGERLQMLVFCMPDSQTVRVISLRKANSREVKIYAENS